MDESVRCETSFSHFCIVHMAFHARGTLDTLMKFKTMAEVSDISLSKDVLEKAVKNALGRVNTSGPRYT